MNETKSDLKVAGWIVAAASFFLFLASMVNSCEHVLIGKYHNDTIYAEKITEKCDTIYQIDTITIEKPKLVYKERIKTIFIEDSVDVEQKVYFDSTYTAWVSGIDVELDSIRTYNHITFIRDSVFVNREYYIEKPTKKKRWSVGLQGGYGIGTTLTPYIGVGISYNLFSF